MKYIDKQVNCIPHLTCNDFNCIEYECICCTEYKDGKYHLTIMDRIDFEDETPNEILKLIYSQRDWAYAEFASGNIKLVKTT